MAANAILKSGDEASMANILMVFGTPLFTKVRFQQLPQLGELNPVIAGAPPICGKLGKKPNVENFPIAKLLLEHATAASDTFGLSYMVSKVTPTAETKAGRTARTVMKNFIVVFCMSLKGGRVTTECLKFSAT